MSVLADALQAAQARAAAAVGKAFVAGRITRDQADTELAQAGCSDETDRVALLRGRRGQLGPVQYHHLVPRDLGGDDVADNIIPLCDLCHRGITDRLPGHVTALLHTLSDAEYAYAVGKAGEDVWERVYGIRYSR